MEITRDIDGEEYVFTARMHPGTPDSFMEPGDPPELGEIRVFGPTGAESWPAFEARRIVAVGEDAFRAFETALVDEFERLAQQAAQEGYDVGFYGDDE